MRVVFDTNIYVSAFVLPGSSADRAMQRIFDGHDTLLISKPILDELLTTLARKFSRDAEALSRTALLLTDLAELIQPKERVNVFDDDPDPNQNFWGLYAVTPVSWLPGGKCGPVLSRSGSSECAL